jgi:predicted component of type VI protein secretion system
LRSGIQLGGYRESVLSAQQTLALGSTNDRNADLADSRSERLRYRTATADEKANAAQLIGYLAACFCVLPLGVIEFLLKTN